MDGKRFTEILFADFTSCLGISEGLGFGEVNPVFAKSTYPLEVFVSEFICAVFAAEFAGDRLDLREEFVFAPSFGVHSVLCAD